MTPARSITANDCLRTATASILDLPPEAVPHFIEVAEDRHWFTVWSEWLLGRGLWPQTHWFDTLADAPKGWWIAITDEDPADNWTHALVMRGRRVAHDAQEDPPPRRKYVCGYTLEPA